MNLARKNYSDNVLQFNKSVGTVEEKNVSLYIESFLKSVGSESKNTEMTYRRAVEDFLYSTRKKKLSQVNESDLKYELMDVERYQSKLREEMKASTVNTKMTAIKKCMSKLNAYGLDVNDRVFELKRLKEYDSETYDAMTIDEIRKAIEIVSTTQKGLEKSLFIKVAFATAFRRESLSNLKWSDISIVGDDYVLRVLGKGNKWDEKKISKELYGELLKIKDLSSDGRVFGLAKNTIANMMKLIRKEIDFGDRNIS